MPRKPLVALEDQLRSAGYQPCSVSGKDTENCIVAKWFKWIWKDGRRAYQIGVKAIDLSLVIASEPLDHYRYGVEVQFSNDTFTFDVSFDIHHSTVVRVEAFLESVWITQKCHHYDD